MQLPSLLTRRHLCWLALWPVLAWAAYAQTNPAPAQPSRQPVLRIETGMHTAAIGRIATDAANRWLVTASVDKTARVWELTADRSAARLVRVLRPPVGAGNEGKLGAVALSPDGQTIAVGGWTGYEWDTQNSIYLFERASGRLVRRLPGQPNVIFHLVFAPDGRYLAATMFGGGGVRVYDAATWQLAGTDRECGADSDGADFDAAGRLVTSCYDGYLRLYARPAGGVLRLLAKVQPQGGKQPFSVKFAPTAGGASERVAVGFADTTQVEVYAGRDLQRLYAADTRGVDNGSLSKVAWSWDGATLYAGGRYDAQGERQIRAWSQGGRGSYRDVAASPNTVLDIIGLRGGGVAYGAGDPAFGVLGADGRRTLFTGPAIADYRAMLENFLLAEDGAEVQFFYYDSKTLTRFKLNGRQLAAASGTAANLRAPLTEARGLTVSDWEDTYTPKLNGQALKLDTNEASRSLALAPDGGRFLLGASFQLHLFDRNGVEQWQQPAPGEAWSVNLSGNGKLATAAFGDGTIRWYRATDGQELLAFFPHNDKQRWVLWTPTGYYDCSPGAEDLIGWHVNNGKDAAADWFPASQFRATYYRPDVIDRVLTTLDESEALRLADADAGRKRQEADLLKQLPPVVSILAPADNSETATATVTVRYSLRTPSGEPVTGLKVLLDGRPASITRGQTVRPTATGEVQVTVPERACEISLIAENRFTSSVPATIRLRWGGRPVAAAVNEGFVIKPKLYVLAVGVSRYARPELKLEFAAKDARDFAAAVKAQEGGLYREVVVKVLADAEATRDEVVDGLDWIRKETTQKDVAMIFLAGHGVNDANGVYFFLPVNADPDRLLRTGVDYNSVKTTVESIAGKVLMFVDTCKSGNVLGRRQRNVDINGLVNELSSAENGAVVFAAATGRQSSLEDAAWNNGAFTKALVEGLNGAADYQKTGRITINMLDLYLSERVKKLTGGQQTPTTTKPTTIQDFPIAVRK